ncbi:MAG: hypothetical protein ACOCUU_02415, partial [Nanoarchaeota archaeon]
MKKESKKSKNNKNQKKIKEPRLTVLKTGNFYFPYKDVGKEFELVDSFDVEIDAEKITSYEEIYKKHPILNFKIYADEIWEGIKKFLEENKELKKSYKNCWFVPVTLYKHEDYNKKEFKGKSKKNKRKNKKSLIKADVWIDVLKAKQ